VVLEVTVREEGKVKDVEVNYESRQWFCGQSGASSEDLQV
jgi:hypothetical protein